MPGGSVSEARDPGIAPAIPDERAVFALFGKLPQRRDFVTHAMPPALLSPFETFLSKGMGQARQDLGAAFEADYLVMPAWRFWIGSGCFGRAAVGALVPSVDGVGRHFPLAILAIAPEGRRFEHPLVDPAGHLLRAIEARLLAALGADAAAPFDGASITVGLELSALLPAGAAACRIGQVGHEPMSEGGEALDGVLQEARLDAHRRLAAGLSYFWTAGPGGLPPAVGERPARYLLRTGQIAVEVASL